MSIFSSGNFGAWRTPGGDSPLAATRTTDSGDHTLTIRPGADVGDLAAVLGAMPADAVFSEHFGDVDLVLIFRQDPGVSAIVPAGANPSAGPAAASVPRL
ncbi:conserved hypothetical protein [Parafrankia sp. EAN1pec]|uniref:hypothetical protein n=1 Tax=Parafrankia sp. (strain EAN1pec) TaxID=298653 RepID=UPI000054044A|nr:conserved hypothetical protein [Frankia sp. EAN1pec]